jgi:hypothetical protein
VAETLQAAMMMESMGLEMLMLLKEDAVYNRLVQHGDVASNTTPKVLDSQGQTRIGRWHKKN